MGKLLQLYLKLPETLPPTVEETKPEAPRCPKCGSEMFLPPAKDGSNQGVQFWGCSRFPQCRGIDRFCPGRGTGNQIFRYIQHTHF